MKMIASLSPQQVWDRLVTYKYNYYDSLAALYSGDSNELSRTAKHKSFWNRPSNKCRIHVPLASDIAATSANLLFSSEPTYTIFHEGVEETDGAQQKRLEELIAKNSVANKLIEAAETCAALGDVYVKVRWSNKIDYPLIDIVQPDMAWPEYVLGELRCVHFFTDLVADREKDMFVRVYERYTKGKIDMAMYKGSATMLGTKLPDNNLSQLGYAPEIKTPIDNLMAVHIANVRPNRLYRSSMLGRSDLDGIRDLCDSLDEAFSSWMRDIRLAKAKLIVPAEYLRKKPNQFASNMDSSISATGTWEFDADVETYVAMDINTDVAPGITQSQFSIRSTEHQETCTAIIQYILQMAGYSPQSFGINVEGSSVSGTALNIRERKSAVTKNKKLQYWQGPLEYILTTMIRLDSVLYPELGSDGKDNVSISFADSMGSDASTVAQTIEMLTQAQAVSTITKIRMIHPDWGEQQVNDEVELVKKEYALELDSPNMLDGDYENADAESGKSEDDEKGGEEVNE